MATNTEKANDPSYPVDAWRRMQTSWGQINALLGGTKTMRAARTTYLPQFEKESNKNYEARLVLSFLYPGYSHAINGIIAQPFARPVVIHDEPEYLKPITDDVDGTGKNFTGLLSEVFRLANNYGVAHILVDYSAVSTDQERSIADDEALNARPVMRAISPQSLIGWRHDKDGRLEQIRIKETTEENVGDFGVQSVEQIRYIDQTSWKIYRKDKADNWLVHQEGQMSSNGNPLGFVPLVTFYVGEKAGDFEAYPPHQSLADINVAHWQSMSDQRHIEHFARVPLLFGWGMTDEEREGVVIAPSSFIGASSERAGLGYVEHSGKAIEAGRVDLHDLEEVMRALGAMPFLLSPPGDVKATTVAISESKSNSEIHKWIRDFESGATLVLSYSATWQGEELPEDTRVDIYQDFQLPLGPGTSEADLLLRSYAMGLIDKETLLKEYQRRNLISEQEEIDDIIARAEAEHGQEPAEVGFPAGGGGNQE